jgi:hypothetical protein
MRVLDRPGWVLRLWATAMAAWVLVPVIQYADSWSVRAIGLVLAVVFGGGFALIVRSRFRRVVARPSVHRGIDRWLAGLPAWVSAALIACLYMVVPTAVVLGMAVHFHRLPAESVWGLTGWFLSACMWGGFWPAVWRAQSRL